jgi:hypothetical protein
MQIEINAWLDEHVGWRNGEPWNAQSRRPYTLAKIRATLAESAASYTCTAQDLDEWIKKKKAEPKQNGGNTRLYADELDFVRDRLKDYGADWDSKNILHVLNQKNERIDPINGQSDLISELKLDMLRYNRIIPKDEGGSPIAPKLSIESIRDVLGVMVSKRHQYRLEDLRDQLRYVPGNFPIDDWLNDLLRHYGVDIDNAPWNMTQFKHFLYLIKRRIFGKYGQELPLFFIFFSRKQRAGKTVLIQKLASPFEFAFNGGGVLGYFLNPNDYKSMVAGNFLIDFQELAISSSMKGDRHEIDPGAIAKIKAAITTATLTGRVMFASHNETRVQSAIFSSSTNIHIYDIVLDISGMRRYWEFQMNPPPLDEAFIAQANLMLSYMPQVYQAIDENNPKGFFYPDCPYWEEISRTQDNYTKEDAVSHFLKLKGWKIQSAAEEGFELMSIAALWKEFKKIQYTRGEWEGNVRWLKGFLSQRDILPHFEEKPREEHYYVNKHFNYEEK